MTPYEEMRTWLTLTTEDSTRLRELLPIVTPHLERIVERFYQEILAHPGSRAVLKSPEQVDRLKRTLVVWMREVFSGPHDLRYFESRREIGRRHVRVGLPDRYMFLAMHLVQSELTRVVRDALPEAHDHLASLRKVTTLDLALMTGTYVAGREALQLDALQALLVKHLRVSVFLVDTDGIVRSATEPSARLAGVREPCGHSWRDVLPMGLVAAGNLEVEVSRARARHRAVTLPRVDVESDDGVRSFRVHLVPLEHELASLLIQLEELTDAVEMEARLRRSEALAQLGSLSAAVSHELRNPLAGISGALQVISRSLPEDAPHRPILQKIDAEVRRLNELVSDLLSFARQKKANVGPVDLGLIASETLELVAADHPETRFEQVGDGHAHADPNLIRQILHNLLRNAIDAAGEAGTVRVELEDGLLQVSDSGPGIPEAKRETIFEPFVTTKTRGTGLGLAISRKNAETMHGTLRIVGGPLAGATFALALCPPTSDRTSPCGSEERSG